MNSLSTLQSTCTLFFILNPCTEKIIVKNRIKELIFVKKKIYQG